MQNCQKKNTTNTLVLAIIVHALINVSASVGHCMCDNYDGILNLFFCVVSHYISHLNHHMTYPVRKCKCAWIWYAHLEGKLS